MIGGAALAGARAQMPVYRADSVVVTGTRNRTDVRHLPMTLSVVGRERLERRHEASVLPVLGEQVPGLFVTSRGVMGYGVSDGAAGGISLRGIGGGNTSRMLVLIDGHPQYMGLMGHPISDAYQTMWAEKVEVLRGPASVLYGSNAMGGVINIVTRGQEADGVKTHLQADYGSYNTVTTEVSNRVRRGGFSSVVTGSYNRTDGHRPDMGFEQYGGYLKLGYDFADHWRVFADANVTHFNASNPGMVTEPIYDNDSRVTRGVASAAIENNYEKSSGALKFFYNWGRHKINDGYETGEEPLDYRFHSKDRMMGLSCYQSATFFKGNRVTAGVDWQRMGGEAWNEFLNGDRRELLSDRTEDEVAGYVDFRQMVGRYLSLDAGVRIDHHSQAGTQWVPQAGVAVHLPRAVELKAMVSKGFRNPTLRELYMFASQNPALKPERVMNYEAGVAQRIGNGRFSYGVNLFYLRGDNLIQVVRENGRPQNVNTGAVENWGAEVETRWSVGRAWTLSANYSWLHMVHPIVAAPEHKLFVGGDFARGRWAVSTGVQYIHGLYTSVAPEVKESFVLWNVRASLRVNRWLAVYLRGENLLGQRYEINLGFPMPRATAFGGVKLNF